MNLNAKRQVIVPVFWFYEQLNKFVINMIKYDKYPQNAFYSRNGFYFKFNLKIIFQNLKINQKIVSKFFIIHPI